MGARRSAARAICRVVGRSAARRDPLQADPRARPVFWGRIGPYDAVSRGGILFLLAPHSGHPSARAREADCRRRGSGP